MNTQEKELLGIKDSDWYSKKVRRESIRVGRYEIRQGSHSWDVYNGRGEFIDSFTRKSSAVEFCKALGLAR